jgi:hypothetical protein
MASTNKSLAPRLFIPAVIAGLLLAALLLWLTVGWLLDAITLPVG